MIKNSKLCSLVAFVSIMMLFSIVACDSNPFGEGAIDESFDLGSGDSSSTTPTSLVVDGSAYKYNTGAYATTCLEYINSAAYNSEGDGLYHIDPDGDGASLVAYCNMTRANGGWTLVANRQIQGSNNEDCQSGLDSFFQNSCGSSSSIDSGSSYSIGDTALRESLLSNGEWFFLQYDGSDVADTDDAFIIHHDTSDLFFTSTGTLNRTAVTQVCDINNTNCDNTSVEFLWAGDGYFSSSQCNSGHTASGGTYFGNYGYCHNGNGSYSSNSLFGDREQYNETKLWGHPSGGGSYYERIYVR